MRPRCRRPARDRRALIPNPFRSEEAATRFAHEDLPTLSAAQVWGERVLVITELARRAAVRVRPRIIRGWPTVVTDEGWLLDRLRRLQDEHHRRGQHGA